MARTSIVIDSDHSDDGNKCNQNDATPSKYEIPILSMVKKRNLIQQARLIDGNKIFFLHKTGYYWFQDGRPSKKVCKSLSALP